ncbi:MAG: polysaccharide biosynthesis protein [Defluviitaleaceae bacterium]|nr:polysaccharide biosynthesis protein [Defluviitaleaceae bacterium]
MDNERDELHTNADAESTTANIEVEVRQASFNSRNRPPAAGGFVKQAAILAGASLFVRLLGFFYRIPLTNLIGDEGIAFYGSAYSIYTLALNVSSVFMIATVSRLTSERLALGRYRDAHSLFKTAMVFSMVLGAGVAFFMFFGAEHIVRWLRHSDEVVYSVRAVAPAVLVVSVLTVLRGYFQGMRTTMPTAVSQVVEQIFNVVFSLWLAFMFFDAADVQFAAAGAAGGTAVAAVAALCVVAFIYFLISKALKKRAAEDPIKVKEKTGTQISAILKTALPMVVGLSIFSVATLIDIGMANSRIYASGAFSAEEVDVLLGQFIGKFILFTTLPVSLSMALSAAVIPEITTSHVRLDTDAVRHKTNMALRLSMIISIPAAVGLAVLADPIIAMLIPLHPDGGWLLRFGSSSIVFLAIVHIVTGVLQGLGHVRLPVIGLFFGVLIKIPVNYYLMSVPSINILGAVISTIACFVVAAGLNIFFLYRFTGILPEFVNSFAKPGVAALGMGLVSFSAYNLLFIAVPNAAATLGAITLGFFAYVILMVLVKGFRQSDLNALPLPRRVRNLLS